MSFFSCITFSRGVTWEWSIKWKSMAEKCYLNEDNYYLRVEVLSCSSLLPTCCSFTMAKKVTPDGLPSSPPPFKPHSGKRMATEQTGWHILLRHTWCSHVLAGWQHHVNNRHLDGASTAQLRRSLFLPVLMRSSRKSLANYVSRIFIIRWCVKQGETTWLMYSGLSFSVG